MALTTRSSVIPLLFLIAHFLLILYTLPHTGALNVKNLRNMKSSALPITESSTAQGRSILGAEAVKNVKPTKAIVSKLKRFVDTASASTTASKSQQGPSATPQIDDWHIKAWERSKNRVDQLASFVNQRASAYSAWLKSKNLDTSTAGTHVELVKQFNNEIKAEVISTTGDPVGDYYVPLAVGSTGQPQQLKLDTGTGLSWIQCAPCITCFDQTDEFPIYDPTASDTYATVECDNRICTQYNGAVDYSCVDLEGSSVCGYSTTYLDNSTSIGTMSMDSVTLQAVDSNPVSLTQWVFGCGHDNTGSFGDGQTGVLGLDKSKFSFITQLSGEEGYDFAKSFAYCLPYRVASDGSGDTTDGHIIFGGTDEYYADYNFTRIALKINDLNPSAYYVGLVGITVNDTSAGISGAVVGIQSNGSGGTIMGTGLDGLWLSEEAYEPVRAALQYGTRDLEQTSQDVQATTELGLCYNVPTDDSYVGVPEMKLYFEGTDGSGTPVELQLPKYNYFIPVNDERTVFCYNVYKQETGSLSVIGHSILANYIVEYNADTNEIAIAFNEGCVLPESDDVGDDGGDAGADAGGDAGGADAGAEGGAEGGGDAGAEDGGAEGAAEGGGDAGGAEDGGDAGGAEDGGAEGAAEGGGEEGANGGGEEGADGGGEEGADGGGDAVAEDGGAEEGGEDGGADAEGGQEGEGDGGQGEGEGEGQEGGGEEGDAEGGGGEEGDAEAGGGEGQGEGGNK